MKLLRRLGIVSFVCVGTNCILVSAFSQIVQEVVVQRFSNGKPQVERQVILDAEGNYINHGDYQERNEAGDLIVTGSYHHGLQDGPWLRFCDARDSDLFSKEPYSKFKAPFQSTVEFEKGKLHGLWTISDKEGRTVSQIHFAEGQRNGNAIWYHVNGAPLWQGEFRNGLLDGMFLEKDASGKLVREIRYHTGRKLEKKQELHSNKKVKSEFQQYGPTQAIVTADDWNRSSLATYELRGTTVKHGIHSVYFENGSRRSAAYYEDGQLDGAFESWHSNGQKEVNGSYKQGMQDGQWDWWHPNGMRKSRVNYMRGEVKGDVLAWNDAGKRIQATEPNIATVAVQIGRTPKSETSVAAQRPGNPQRVAIDNSNRPPHR